MASDKVVTLTADNFDTVVLQSPTPVLVDFWAEWCNPCKMLAPILAKLADELADKFHLAKVDTEALTHLGERVVRDVARSFSGAKGRAESSVRKRGRTGRCVARCDTTKSSEAP